MGEETARLRIVQITDVYTLKNFPNLKTLLNEKRAEIDKLGGKTISMLTGDFLAPYLLSSFDKGKVIIYKSYCDVFIVENIRVGLVWGCLVVWGGT